MYLCPNVYSNPSLLFKMTLILSYSSLAPKKILLDSYSMLFLID